MLCYGNLRCFVVMQFASQIYAVLSRRIFLSQIYALLSVKYSGLKTRECKKNDKYQVWPQVILI